MRQDSIYICRSFLYELRTIERQFCETINISWYVRIIISFVAEFFLLRPINFLIPMFYTSVFILRRCLYNLFPLEQWSCH